MEAPHFDSSISNMRHVSVIQWNAFRHMHTQTAWVIHKFPWWLNNFSIQEKKNNLNKYLLEYFFFLQKSPQKPIWNISYIISK